MNDIDIIKEIEVKYKKIAELSVSNDTLSNGPDKFIATVDKIIILLKDLCEISTNDDFAFSVNVAYKNLIHTRYKEVEYLKSKYMETIKKNSARKRKLEYRDEISNCYERVSIDIFYIIEEGKKFI